MHIFSEFYSKVNSKSSPQAKHDGVDMVSSPSVIGPACSYAAGVIPGPPRFNSDFPHSAYCLPPHPSPYLLPLAAGYASPFPLTAYLLPLTPYRLPLTAALRRLHRINKRPLRSRKQQNTAHQQQDRRHGRADQVARLDRTRAQECVAVGLDDAGHGVERVFGGSHLAIRFR